MKKNLALFLIFFMLTLVLAFPAPGIVQAEESASRDLLNETVSYYVNNRTALQHWEEVIGLTNSGVDVDKPPWTLPAWNVSGLNQNSPVGDYAGVILGMLGAGQDPASVDGRNLVQELADRQNATGEFSTAVNYTIWAMIALDTAKGTYNDTSAVSYLLSQQKSDGGFAFSGGTGDPDLTGMALMALAGHENKPGVSACIDRAKNFLKGVQLATAGFGNPESAESIACVIRGLTACGEDVTTSEWQQSSRTMVDALLDFRLANYSFAHLKGSGSNPMATRQALIALSDLVNGNVFFNLKDIVPGPGGGGGQATVKVRVEGAAQSKAEETVTVSGSALDALKAAVGESNVTAPGGYVTAILGEGGQAGVAPGTDTSWMYYVIRGGGIEENSFNLGADGYSVADGDEVIFYIGAYGTEEPWPAKTYFPVVAVSPAEPKAGQTVTLTLGAKKYKYSGGLSDLSVAEAAYIGDYTVVVNGTTTYTSQAGQVTLSGLTEGELSYTVSNPNPAGYPDVITCKGKITVGPGVQKTVKVRVEGATRSKAEETVTVSGSALDALKAAVGAENVALNSYGSITTILGEGGQAGVAPGTDTSWMYYVIRGGGIEENSFNLGADGYSVADGDEVVFYIGAYDAATYAGKTYFPVVAVSPVEPKGGQAVTLILEAKKYEWGSGLSDLSVAEAAYIGDYTVVVNGTTYTSQSGQVTLRNLTEGELSYTVSNPNPAGYPDVVTYKGKITVGPAGGGDGGNTNPDEISVYIAVVGRDGELLYGPGSVAVSKTGQWGCTVLGALHATGLDYTISNEYDDGFVVGVGGQANSGTNGWMFKVNNVIPLIPAKDKTVKSRDKIIWWYSEDMDSNGPEWDSLGKTPGGPGSAGSSPASEGTATTESSPQISREAQEALDKIAELLGLQQGAADLGPVGEAAIAVVVVNGDDRLSRSGFADLKKELSENIVDLTQEVEAAKGASIADPLGEVSLLIPPGALETDTSISITETTAFTGSGSSEDVMPANYRQISSVYQFGPEGTSFKEPVTLALKVALPPLVAPENITLAWYDKANARWVSIPAVVDVGNGLVIAKVSHFSDFAVLARQEKESFEDVTLHSYGWAREPIELLAGAKVISGVDGRRFEPGRAITRAELTVILVKAMNLPAATGGAAFTDVTGDEWYAAGVAAAAEAGLVAGYEDGAFRPDRTITREEMVAVLVRALDLVSPSEAAQSFKDEDSISAWAKDSVAAAVSSGLIKGYPDETFRPRGTATRAECAVMVYYGLIDQ